ncbi:hypothetical protein L579_1525 [Pantoea sp. AS-PWVM4]|nr:hypothetical protein L579_1525 [Pantoea sp. AS-PWVM4]
MPPHFVRACYGCLDCLLFITALATPYGINMTASAINSRKLN